MAEPWMTGDLVLTRSALDAVEADARRGYDEGEEACGYLRGPSGNARCDEQVRMVNLANKLHAVDPVQFFRTGREFFAFNEKRFADAVEASAKEGRPVKVIYHSHLDAGAYFSPTDAAVLSMGEPPAFEGGPIQMGPGPAFPVVFLVTSVRSTGVDDTRLFLWDSDSRSFVQGRFTVIEG